MPPSLADTIKDYLILIYVDRKLEFMRLPLVIMEIPNLEIFFR